MYTDVKSSRYTLEIYSFDNCISIKLKKANPRRQKKMLVEQLVCSWAVQCVIRAARQHAPPEMLGDPHTTQNSIYKMGLVSTVSAGSSVFIE